MVIMILENVSPSLRGELTRWLIEQRFEVRTFGETRRTIVDYEGLRLVRRK